jgi:hypothetical protein
MRPALFAEVDDVCDKDVPPGRVGKGALNPAFEMPLESGKSVCGETMTLLLLLRKRRAGGGGGARDDDRPSHVVGGYEVDCSLDWDMTEDVVLLLERLDTVGRRADGGGGANLRGDMRSGLEGVSCIFRGAGLEFAVWSGRLLVVRRFECGAI